MIRRSFVALIAPVLLISVACGQKTKTDQAATKPGGATTPGPASTGPQGTSAGPTLKERATLKGHTLPVGTLAFSPDGKLLASGGGDQTVKLWDVGAAKELRAVNKDKYGTIEGLAFTGDNKKLATVHQQRTVFIWDLESKGEPQFLQSPAGNFYNIAMTPDGKKLAVANDLLKDGSIPVWEVDSMKELPPFKGHTAAVRCLGVSADGSVMASGGQDKTVKSWDFKDGKELRTMKCDDEIMGLAISGNGKVIASVDLGRKLKIWDATAGTLTASVPLTGEVVVYDVAVSPDGKLVAIPDQEKGVRLYDAAKGSLLATVPGHPRCFSVAFSADGKMLASGSSDSTIKLWDVVE